MTILKKTIAAMIGLLVVWGLLGMGRPLLYAHKGEIRHFNISALDRGMSAPGQETQPSWRNLWGIVGSAQPSNEVADAQTAEVPLVDWITPIALVIGALLSAGIWFLLVGRARS